MGNSPAFQFYAADYLADANVQLMTLEEEGCYVRLLAFCWREGSIPADENVLSRLCKGASTAAIRVVIACFEKHPNDASKLVHSRLEKEREKQQIWREKSSEGGKKAAKKRWGNKSKNKGGIRVVKPPCNQSDKGGVTLQSSSSSSNIKEEEVVEVWNSSGPLPKVQSLSAGRKKHLAARMRDPFFLENWRDAIKRITSSPFCTGQNDRGWVADFDFFLRPDTVAKVAEGKYDAKASARPNSAQNPQGFDRSLIDRAAFDAWAAEEYHNPPTLDAAAERVITRYLEAAK